MAQYKGLRPRRRRIFMGVEGESERSLVRWWKHLCDEAESHVHLDVVVGGGGDGLAIAEFAVKRYRQVDLRRASSSLMRTGLRKIGAVAEIRPRRCSPSTSS